MTCEKIRFQWNDFESNIRNTFHELREDRDFLDVTLACDEGQIQAHKVILSSCSPFFRRVLRGNRHEHPLLYLKGVNYTNLLFVTNFIYYGQVEVPQGDVQSFLSTAEDLKIKGLAQTGWDTSSSSLICPSNTWEGKHAKPEPSGRQSEEADSGIVDIYGDDFNGDEYTDMVFEREMNDVAVDSNMFTPDLGKDLLNTAMLSLIEAVPGSSSHYSCKRCGKIFIGSYRMKRHVKTHLQISHNCSLCSKVFKSKDTLQQHTLTAHSTPVKIVP